VKACETRRTAFVAHAYTGVHLGACAGLAGLASLAVFAGLASPVVARAQSTSVSPFADTTGQFLSPPGGLPRDWAGVRSLGMGDAFTTVGNDELAAFTNPAGLARSRNPRSKAGLHDFSFPGLVVGGNSTGAKELAKGGKPALWPRKLAEASQAAPGDLTYGETQAYPYAIFGGRGSPTFLFGLPARSQLLFQASPTSASPGARSRTLLFSETTMSAALGIADTSRGGSFAYGLMLRPDMRYSMLSTDADTATLTAASLRDGVKAGAVRTRAVALDAGVLFTAADFWFPTLGVAVRNAPTGCAKDYVNPANGKTVEMCGTRRTPTGGQDPVDATTGEEIAIPTTRVDPTELRVGFSITPRGRVDGTKINLRLAVDVFPIPVTTGGKRYGVDDVPLNEMIHAGTELFFGNALTDRGLSLRAGMNDSRPTYGATVDFLGVRLDAAHYSVRVGLRDRKRYDDRYLIGLSAGW
jgi:hypothetical protein